jgi:hypothetical protein
MKMTIPYQAVTLVHFKVLKANPTADIRHWETTLGCYSMDRTEVRRTSLDPVKTFTTVIQPCVEGCELIFLDMKAVRLRVQGEASD